MIFVIGKDMEGTTYSMLKIWSRVPTWSPGNESLVYDDEF
jgi:hypothetical protein